MKPRRTHNTDTVYRLPGGTEDDDLWTYVVPDNTTGTPIVCSSSASALSTLTELGPVRWPWVNIEDLEADMAATAEHRRAQQGQWWPSMGGFTASERSGGQAQTGHSAGGAS